MDSTTQNNTLPKGFGMAAAALAMGIAALGGLLFLLPGILCGGLAIVFALLSKGRADKMTSQAKAGLTMGVIALSASLLITCTFVYTIISSPDFMEQYEILYEQMYGRDFQDDMDTIIPEFPDDFEQPDPRVFPDDTF